MKLSCLRKVETELALNCIALWAFFKNLLEVLEVMKNARILCGLTFIIYIYAYNKFLKKIHIVHGHFFPISYQ